MSLCAPAGEKMSPGCGSSHHANVTIVAAVAAYWCWMQSHIMLTAATSHNRRQVLCWTRPPRQGSLKDFSCLHSCGAWAPLVMQKHAQSLTSFSGVCAAADIPAFLKGHGAYTYLHVQTGHAFAFSWTHAHCLEGVRSQSSPHTQGVHCWYHTQGI